ncbi:MAG: hypothetical protein KBD90_02535 [Alphaproteobacteria bacterium]|nr:hypothetical protein [Alphaproteobacteria bacterium]
MYKINFLVMTALLSLNMSAYAMEQDFVDNSAGKNVKAPQNPRDSEEKSNKNLVEAPKKFTTKIESSEEVPNQILDNTISLRNCLLDLREKHETYVSFSENRAQIQNKCIVDLDNKLRKKETTIFNLKQRLSNLEEKMFTLESNMKQHIYNKDKQQAALWGNFDDEEEPQHLSLDSEEE